MGRDRRGRRALRAGQRRLPSRARRRRLARSAVPVSAVLQTTVGSIGARLASLAIAVTTLGFMSNRMLTVPRLYHAMAHDGLFFRAWGKIDPRTGVPVVAIVLQGIVAVAIALSGGYEHILNYVVSTFYFLTACSRSRSLCCARATADPDRPRPPASACRGIRSQRSSSWSPRGPLRLQPASQSARRLGGLAILADRDSRLLHSGRDAAHAAGIAA